MSYWVSIYADPRFTAVAASGRPDEAVRHIGTNAIPYLLNWIASEPPRSKAITAINVPIRWLNRKLAPKADWTIRDASPFLRSGAPMGFKALSGQAESAVPELIRLFGKSKVDVIRRNAEEALVVIGQPAIPGLKRLLNETDVDATRVYTAGALVRLEKRGPGPVTEAITNANVKVRRAAAAAISELENNAETAIPNLIHALDDSDETVKWLAYHQLCNLKPDLALILPVMITHVASENPSDRMLAALVLGEYKSLARPALPDLIRAFDNTKDATNLNERYKIFEAIQKIDPQAITNEMQRIADLQKEPVAVR